MNFQSSTRILFLLAIIIPSALISNRVGAVESSDRQLENINVSSNTIDKLRELLPQNQLIAKSDTVEVTIPSPVPGNPDIKCTGTVKNGKIVKLDCPTPPPGPFAQENGPEFVRSSGGTTKSLKLKAQATPSAVEVLRSLSANQVG
jgi:hypothetical protein